MNVKVSVLLLISIIIGLSACKKYNDAPAATPPASNLNVINASADTVNFYLNGTRLNVGNLYPSGSSGYFSVFSGAQNYQVKNIFNSSTNTVKTLFTYPLKLDSAAYSSLFIAGASADQAFKITDALNLTDTVALTAYVRFVNASTDAGTMDMHIGGDTLKFVNQQFKQASDFALIASGLKAISLYQSGSSLPIISGHVILQTGYSYTFYVKGLKNGTGNSALGIGTTLNVN